MDELNPQRSSAENYRRKVTLAMTPEQRMVRCEELIRHAFEQLRANPPAYQEFLRRNHHARRHRSQDSQPIDPLATDKFP